MTTIAQLILDNPQATDAEILGLCAPVVTTRPYYISHRTTASVCGLIAAEWVAGALKAQAPATYDVYVAAGATDGTAGGIDVSDPATQVFLTELVQMSAADTARPGLFTADMRTALISLGQVTTYPTGQAETLETVAAARAAATLNAVRNARLVLIEAWASYARNAVNAAKSADAMPAVPEVPQT